MYIFLGPNVSRQTEESHDNKIGENVVAFMARKFTLQSSEWF